MAEPVQLSPLWLQCMDCSGRGVVGQPAGSGDVKVSDLVDAISTVVPMPMPVPGLATPKRAEEVCRRILFASDQVTQDDRRACKAVRDWLHSRLLKLPGSAGSTGGIEQPPLMPLGEIADAFGSDIESSPADNAWESI